MRVNRRTIIQIVTAIILISGFGSGLYLVQHPAIFNPHAASDVSLCTASDPSSLKECLSEAQNNESINKIEITKQIICHSLDECTMQDGWGFVLSKRSSPLTIFGTPNTNAGFKRVENYNYPLLISGDFTKANEVSNITLKDLVFDETTTSCDFTKQGFSTCNSPLILGPKISNSVIDHITVLHAKNMGIQVWQATNLTIRNSIVFDSEGDGLWFDAAYPGGTCNWSFDHFEPCPIDTNTISRYITIENNLFADNKVSAIEYSGFGDQQNPSIIRKNLITHNHRDSKYTTCPPPNGHCPGGQVYLKRISSLIIEENVIRDGLIDAINPDTGTTYESQGLHGTGIELADSLNDMKIQNNKIYANSGGGVYADYLGSNANNQNVSILWNVLYANGSNIMGADLPNFYFNLENRNFPGLYIANNILNNPQYNAVYPQSFIFADPPICSPSDGMTACQTNIHWYSNDYSSIKVTVKNAPGSVFASGLNGVQSAPWIANSGVGFELRNADDTILAETTASNDALPAASASGTVLVGDVDNDGDIDLYDFNNYIPLFKNKDPKADLNSSGTIDIFDFNQMVQNFKENHH